MNINYFLFLLTTTVCANMQASHKTRTTPTQLPSTIVFIGTPSGIVPYVLDNNSSDFQFDDLDKDPNQSLLTHNSASYTTTTAQVLATILLQQSKPKTPIVRERKAGWFTDDQGKKYYGIVTETNCDEPFCCFEEEVYVYKKRTLFWRMDHPIVSPAIPSTLADIDEDSSTTRSPYAPSTNASFSSTPTQQLTEEELSRSFRQQPTTANSSFGSTKGRSPLCPRTWSYVQFLLPKNK